MILKKFITSILVSEAVTPDVLVRFKEKFLKSVADDPDRKAKIIAELEKLKTGDVKPGSNLEKAKMKFYSNWDADDFQQIIDHLNNRALPDEATDTIAEIVLDLAMMHPDSEQTKALFTALETKDFSSQSAVHKVIVSHMPPEWKKDDYIDIVKRIVKKSEED